MQLEKLQCEQFFSLSQTTFDAICEGFVNYIHFE